MERPEYKTVDLEIAFDMIKKMMEVRLLQKGKGIYMSSHEIKGVICEEWDEYKEAVKTNNTGDQYDELVDIGVAVVFGIASMLSNKMDWL